MPEISLRDAVEEDLPIIQSIESKVYPTPWTLNFFRIIFHMNQGLFILAIDNNELVGYTVGEIESMGKVSKPRKAGHIMNVAVRADYQGMGVASMLLDEIEKRFMARLVNIAYLEVRESNTHAQSVYRHRGYQYVRTAKEYYGDEDGFIMTKKLEP